MSRLYSALKKQNENLVVTKPEIADFVGDNRIYNLPPILIDYSRSVLEEIACLYRNLFILKKGELGSIMICSDQAGAGTSMIALNLAAYIVKNEGVKTLFIEANFRRPLLFKFQQRSTGGFSELLSEQGSIENYVYPTASPALYIMGAGKVTGSSENLLTENRLQYTLRECKAP